MKTVTNEEIEIAEKQSIKQIQLLVKNTDMTNNNEKKRTKNYCDWIDKKTYLAISEKSFNSNAEMYDVLKRGSVVWVEFGFNVGTEFGGRHPAIILRRTGDSAFVLPLSSQSPHIIKPYHVKIEKIYGFKELTRWANVLKIRDISLQRIDIKASIGNVKGDVLDLINDAIKNTHIF